MLPVVVCSADGAGQGKTRQEAADMRPETRRRHRAPKGRYSARYPDEEPVSQHGDRRKGHRGEEKPEKNDGDDARMGESRA